jgi:peptidyl-prolyl cis-trans isomerase SurA
MNARSVCPWLGLGLACLVGMPARGQPDAIPVEGYAAVVNDRVIMASDVLAQMYPLEQQLRASYQGEELHERLADAYDRVLEELVNQALILEEFERQEGQIPDRALDEHMDTIIRDRFNDDRGQWMEALSRERMTTEEWRHELKEELVASLMGRQEVTDFVNVAPAAIRAEYEATLEQYRRPERVRLRILTVAKGATREEILEQAQKIKDARARMLAGESFEAVARDVSEHPTAEIGGDYGWRAPSDLRPELERAVRIYAVGELSEALVAGETFYLIRVEEHEKEQVTPFEEVEQEITERLRRQQADTLRSAWLERLRRRHYVKIY